MIWKTKVSREEFSLAGGGTLALELEELASLEETIDDLFIELERTGNPNLLEDLCPYFGSIWPAARALTEYLLANTVEQDGAVQILEVGCGLAIPSMALAKVVRFSKIIATDFHPEVPVFLEKNLTRNGILASRFEYRRLDWKTIAGELGRFGLIIGSDVLYEKSHPGDVAEALVQLAKPTGRIIIADPGRPYLQIFVDEMRARGFAAEPTVITITGSETKDVLIFDFQRIQFRDTRT